MTRKRAMLNYRVRYLVKAKLRAGKEESLVRAIENETLGQGSIAGDEYIYNMNQARVAADGTAR